MKTEEKLCKNVSHNNIVPPVVGCTINSSNNNSNSKKPKNQAHQIKREKGKIEREREGEQTVSRKKNQ